jgi:predicted homoserine dehydrogenase-like protein
MNYHALLSRSGRVVRAALIGTGEFGCSLVSQSLSIDNLDVRVLCDRNLQAARDACRRAGVPQDAITVCDSPASARKNFGNGRYVLVEDSALAMDLPVDIVVEATGNPEAGAANAAAAIALGKHVAMATKEADSVIGPVLHGRARRAGLTYTPVDGDQPSLLLGLLSWARTLGLEVVAAGKSSEYDFIYDPAAETVSWRDRSVEVPGFAASWQLAPGDRAGTITRRAKALAALPQRTVPDLCEMGLVVNASKLSPDTPSFHAPLARTVEVPDVFCPRDDGGILEATGVIDVFNCLRRPDEASFAGGVFIVVACRDAATWRTLRDKGIPTSGNGRYALLYNPQHLLGVEAPVSILSAVLLNQSTGGVEIDHRCDLVARAARDFAAGETLTITDQHHHEVDGLEPLLVEPARALGANPLPYYMAVERRLTRPLPAGSLVGCDMVERDGSSTLWSLRAEQDNSGQS